MRASTLGAVVAAVTLTVASCGSDDDGGDDGSSGTDLNLVSDGTLTVCSDIPYPPFEVPDDTAPSGYTGFDIELMQAIADGLGLELAVQDTGFEALQSGLTLASGQCDIAASAMTITKEREANLDFTDPYYDSEQSLLVPTDSDIASIDDLAGASVGVQQGTTGKSYTEDNAPEDADIVAFPSDAEMYSALEAGQVDALLQDLPVNVEHAKTGDYTIVEKYQTDESYGFAVAEDDYDALREATNEQLQTLRDDGTYDKIYESYFGTK
ncbi:MAG: amino acid ABC transporter substrate-binding protein [Nocardioidaceae bacterium]|nr:amino acid ABC transporter substrate-binding protein [Nocardioidaceae bacterium]